MSKAPTPTPDRPTTDEIVAESRRVQELILSAAADVEAWSSVLRKTLAEMDDDDD